MKKVAPPHLVKILYIEQVVDSAQRALNLENECRSFFQNRELLADFTVVRDCLSALEQIEIVEFNVIVVDQHVKYVSGVELLNALRRFGYSIPVIFVSDGVMIKSDTMSLARSLGYFGVIVRSSECNQLAMMLLDAIYRGHLQDYHYINESDGFDGSNAGLSSSSTNQDPDVLGDQFSGTLASSASSPSDEWLHMTVHEI